MDHNNSTKVALIDDDNGVCSMVEDVLKSGSHKYDFKFSNTIPGFKSLVTSFKPVIAFIDIYLPYEGQGFEALKWLKAEQPHIKTVVFTTQTHEILEAVLNNADGFISKDEVELIPQVIQFVFDQGIYMSPKNTRVLVQKMREHESTFKELLGMDLTPRDKVNLEALVKEKTNQRAAQKLGENINTFKSQNTRILKKFKTNRMQNILGRFGRFFK